MILPKSWKEITVEQFIELQGLDQESFGSLFLYNLEVLSIATNEPIEDLEELDVDTLLNHINQLAWLKKEPPRRIEAVEDLRFKPFKHITLGEFIDLEYYFGQNYVEHLPTICGICYRLVGVNNWKREEFEPYQYSPKERGVRFLEVPISDVYGIVREYLEFRDGVIKAYENLFNPDIEEDDSEMDEEDRKAEAEERIANKWSWERVILDLAGGDITKVDQVTDLPLIMALNFMSMRYELKL